MKRFFSFFIALCISLSTAGAALALSDADFKKYKKESPNFVQADKKLGQIWKAVRKAHGGAIPAALIEEQRQWISNGRDVEAKALFDKMPPAEAYATVTNNRTQALQSEWLDQAERATSPAQSADISGTYLGYYQGKYDTRSSVTIQKRPSGEYDVELAIVGDPNSGVNAWCSFKGKATLQNKVLKASAVSDADGKTYSLPLSFIGNNSLAITDKNEAVRAKFCGGPAMLEGTYKRK